MTDDSERWTDEDITDDLLGDLEEQYERPDVPPCPVCGEERGVHAIGGGGPAVFACGGMEDDPEREGYVRYKEGRRPADEHYRKSRIEVGLGDSRVVRLVRAYRRLRGGEGERWDCPVCGGSFPQELVDRTAADAGIPCPLCELRARDFDGARLEVLLRDYFDALDDYRNISNPGREGSGFAEASKRVTGLEDELREAVDKAVLSPTDGSDEQADGGDHLNLRYRCVCGRVYDANESDKWLMDRGSHSNVCEDCHRPVSHDNGTVTPPADPATERERDDG